MAQPTRVNLVELSISNGELQLYFCVCVFVESAKKRKLYQIWWKRRDNSMLQVKEILDCAIVYWRIERNEGRACIPSENTNDIGE